MKHILTFSLLAMLLNVSAQGAYFQQTVNTDIEVKLDDKNHFLHAKERIEYINNSKDILDKLIFHIWPNAYKNNSTDLATQLEENGELDFHFASALDRGFIDSLDFVIDGKKVTYSLYQDNQDIIELNLNAPIQPGQKVIIETPFRVKIPKGIFSRLGHIGESYQITQWYPKPAVYDLQGWHPLVYLSQGEFFSEYGSFDVKITLPENYVVGATGDLVNGEKELEFLNQKAAATQKLIDSDSSLFEDNDNPDMSFPPSRSETKTLHYHQENVHDFAWFADKRFYVLKGEVELPISKRKVTTWSMFTNSEFNLWTKSIEYLNDATLYYSKWTGEYPYNHVTAVDGSISAGGGMEYPNVTVIGKSGTAKALEQVIVHEVGHNWFYGILGSNERINAWMDEGLNTYTENRYTETKYPDSKLDIGLPQKLSNKVGLGDMGPRGVYDIGYVFNARRNYDQPIQIPSNLFTPINYGGIVYGKTAIGFDYLLAYLGDDLFDDCMHAYFDEWKFKHPQPEDVQKVFERVSKKNLSWLFDDYIKTNKKMDYGISKVKTKGDSILVTIINKAQISAPLNIQLSEQGVAVNNSWHEGFIGKKTFPFKYNGADKIQIDATNDMPTVNRKDDQAKTSGMLKKTEPLALQFLISYEKPNKTQIFYAPAVGFNSQDKLMLGAAFYNISIPQKNFEWMVAPMYATRSKKLVGTGDMKYSLNVLEGWIRKVTFGYNFKSYTTEGSELTNFYKDQTFSSPTLVDYSQNWFRHEVSADFELNNQNLRKSMHNIIVRGLNISEAISLFNTDITNAINVSYIARNKQVLKPAAFKVDVVSTKSLNFGTFTGVSFVASLRRNYNINRKGIELRIFGGQTLSRNSGGSFTSKYNWSLSGQTGTGDFLYDHTLLGRNQSFPDLTSQQSTGTQGDFKVNSRFNIGSNDQWILATNLKAELPINLPIGIFADAGLHPLVNITPQGTSTTTVFQYSSGVYVPIKKDIFEIYVPLVYSKDIQNQIAFSNVSFLQRVRFVLHFNKINPFDILRRIAY